MRAAALSALVVCAAVAGLFAQADQVEAVGANRAAVIVTTQGGTVARCVRFTTSSISGVDALRAAGFELVTAGFGGLGAGVCSIGGEGCPAASCFTCQAPKSWKYYRAPGGSGSWSYSELGASATTVSDGDVEGWIFTSGDQKPGLQSVDEVCGPEPSSTSSVPAAAPAPLPAEPPASNQEGDTPVGVAGTTEVAPGSADIPQPPPSTAGEPQEEASEEGSPTDPEAGETGGEVATAPDSDLQLASTPTGDERRDGGGTAALSIVLAILALAVPATALVVIRRRNRTLRDPTPS